MKEPVDHILRSRLPWRVTSDGAITECGYDAAKVNTLTRAEFFQRQKELGDRRTAMITCMTCADTVRRWKTWEEDPRAALGREIEWEHGGLYYRSREDRGHRLLDELLSIERLIEAHRAEFDAMVVEGEQRREWREKKAALAQRPKVPKPSVGL